MPAPAHCASTALAVPPLDSRLTVTPPTVAAAAGLALVTVTSPVTSYSAVSTLAKVRDTLVSPAAPPVRFTAGGTALPLTAHVLDVTRAVVTPVTATARSLLVAVSRRSASPQPVTLTETVAVSVTEAEAEASEGTTVAVLVSV